MKWLRLGGKRKQPEPSTCAVCKSDIAVKCVACETAACDDPWHIYHLFATKRYGTDADQVGSKFAYHCPNCRGFVCVDDLGLRDDYPCPPDRVEYHPFTCPACNQRLFVMRMDNVDGMEAAAEIQRYLKDGTAGEAQTMPYDRYDRVEVVEPGLLLQVPFGPRPRPLRCGEAWESVIRLRADQGEQAELVLEHSEYPPPSTKLFLRVDGRIFPLKAPTAEDEVWSTEVLGDRLPQFGGRHVTLRLGREGFSVAHVDDRHTVEVERVGIRPFYVPEAQAAPLVSSAAGSGSAGSVTRDESHESAPDDKIHRRRKHLAQMLHDLTGLHIWDYMWIEAPPPPKMGSKAVLTLAGSTDLTYYELVRVYFRGVRYNTFPVHFSHPHFALAVPAEEVQLRDLACFGKRSFAVRLLTDFGGSLQKSAFLVADWIDVKQLAGGEQTSLYRPIHPGNVDWW